MTPEPAKSIFEGLKNGDRSSLARSITAVEGNRKDQQALAEEILGLCMPLAGNSVRIGITGIPGVGKSTFIDSFGKYLIDREHRKVAVLAVDPSSPKSSGSILGDKTRMTTLTQEDRAFIRPSPSSGGLGGVGMASRECIVLCEAAGYDTIIVETVGVGQSETEVRDMVDFFLLMMLPGAGDELQGIKRGVFELADAVLINKADGDNLKPAGQAKSSYSNAMNLFPPGPSDWKPKVETCSALEGTNLDLTWKIITDFVQLQKNSGYFETLRKEQLKKWFRHGVESGILNTFRSMNSYEKILREYEDKVMAASMSARKASRLLIEKLNAKP